MPSQTLGFAELLGGGVLLYAAISGESLSDVVQGKRGSPAALTSDIPFGPSTDQSAMASLAGPVAGRGGRRAKGSTKGAVNPVPGFTPGRVDQGVDFAPTHDGQPIYSPFAGTVIKTGAPGWPGGAGGVLIRMANGQIWYFYESLSAAVHAGEKVAAGQVIAHAHTGGTGIEIGLADSSGVPLSHAGYYEGKATQAGQRIKHILQELGVHWP